MKKNKLGKRTVKAFQKGEADMEERFIETAMNIDMAIWLGQDDKRNY